MELDGAEAVSTVFHRSRIRSDKRLTYGEDEIFAGRASRVAPWGEPPRAREAAAALRAKRDALELGAPEPVFEST